MNNYNLKFFRDIYIETRNEQKNEKAIEEAFMAGAHTALLMTTATLQSSNPEVGLRKLTQEAVEYKTLKEAEHAKFH